MRIDNSKSSSPAAALCGDGVIFFLLKMRRMPGVTEYIQAPKKGTAATVNRCIPDQSGQNRAAISGLAFFTKINTRALTPDVIPRAVGKSLFRNTNWHRCRTRHKGSTKKVLNLRHIRAFKSLTPFTSLTRPKSN